MSLDLYRKKFLQVVFDLMGVDYIWNGKDRRGLDCSGLVTLALYEASGCKLDLRATHNTDALWDELEETAIPDQGDLALYGSNKDDPDDMDHVMVVGGGGWLFGASGGGHTCTSVEIARERNAKVKAKYGVNYREGFRGFRTLPKFTPV